MGSSILADKALSNKEHKLLKKTPRSNIQRQLRNFDNNNSTRTTAWEWLRQQIFRIRYTNTKSAQIASAAVTSN